MYLTVKQQLKHLTSDEYQILLDLSHTAKNLANEAIYNIRQHFFSTGKRLSYSKNNQLLKSSENYRRLNSNMSQQILMDVDESFRSFFALRKRAMKGDYDPKKVRLPQYLPKDGYKTLIIGFVRLKGRVLVLPYSVSYKKNHAPLRIHLPYILKDKSIKEVRIVPKADGGYFEVQYSYEAVVSDQQNGDAEKALSLDLGINNLVTAVSTEGKSFIIDGRRLKAINQWYNKEHSRLQSIKDHQRYGHGLTKRQWANIRKRNARINDYMSKTAKTIISYCIQNDIGTLVVGKNEDFQLSPHMGTATNQTFTAIPYGKLVDKLEYLCELNGIRFFQQEESYTSKASFWDKDDISVYGEDPAVDHSFRGRRIHRGLYVTADGIKLNADVNGALNILKKSNVVSLAGLYARGVVDTPLRIRVA